MPNLIRVISAAAIVLSIIINATGQSKTDANQSPVRIIDSPAGPASGEPNLFAASDGRIYLSWIEKTDAHHHALRFSILDGTRWTEPRAIAEGDNWFVNWADFPSLIALPGGVLAAHWLVKNGANAHGYDIQMAFSKDGGKTWSKPITPHRDGTPTEHGFVSMLPMANGRVAAFWLDGRKFKSQANEHESHESLANEMTLRYAIVDSNGQLSEEAELDARVCDCCQTSAALTADGPVVVYRDRSEKEIRDISIIRREKGSWSRFQAISADNWRIEGCPVNGPSVAAEGRRVAVAWFTATDNKPRVNVAFSKDAGANFSKPVQVDEGSPMGRVQTLLLSDGSAIICWLERMEKTAVIKARRVRADGTRDASITIAETTAARASGFPRMAKRSDELVFAWTEAGEPSRVRVAAMKISK
ncbi:MAG TPA: sialidase family protein [Blastocatellia bacterium]|nr:sialidase family protein [Blastocatellia bacterium]